MSWRRFVFVACFAAISAASAVSGERLSNGIELPDLWPPQSSQLSRELAGAPSYLVRPPEVIEIDVGRQLFVDDFLIESTSLKRTFHRPEYHSANPVLQPDRPWEGSGGRARAACFSDGVWFDPADGLFKMWYWASSHSTNPLVFDTGLATSRDGIRWEKPEFDVVPGTNIMQRDDEGRHRNSSTVWLDYFDKDPERRFKMFRVVKRSNFNRVRFSVSPDGLHWRTIGETDDVGDRTTVFQNPFRQKWAYSLRTGTADVGRCRDRAFCPISENKDDWNGSNVQSAGGCCLMVGDRLHFYVGGVSGRLGSWHPDPSFVGLATMRRDGFASLDAGNDAGTITTRPVRFSGKHLFVNVAAADGEVRAELLDQDDRVIEPFTLARCESPRLDRTLAGVRWRGATALPPVANKPVRFRFQVRNGSLYAFWVSPDARGASRGYTAVGGPGFTGPTDTAESSKGSRN